MTRKDIAACLPLLLKHFDLVVTYLEVPRTASSKNRKASRRRILADYIDLHDMRGIASAHGVSVNVVATIIKTAVNAARRVENGTLQMPEPRKSYSLTLPGLPAAVIHDIDAWAADRHTSRREAAIELLRIGVETVAKRHARAQP